MGITVSLYYITTILFKDEFMGITVSLYYITTTL